jgi:hypothetical protein
MEPLCYVIVIVTLILISGFINGIVTSAFQKPAANKDSIDNIFYSLKDGRQK